MSKKDNTFTFRKDFETIVLFDILKEQGVNLSNFTREAVKHRYNHMAKRNYCKKLILDGLKQTNLLIKGEITIPAFSFYHLKILKEVYIALLNDL